MNGQFMPHVIKSNLVFSYDPEENVIRDINGYIRFNMFRFITPNQLYLFKKNKENAIVFGNSGDKITLLYLNKEVV